MKIQIWTNEKENKAIATVEMFPEKNVVDGFQKWGTVATSLSDEWVESDPRSPCNEITEHLG